MNWKVWYAVVATLMLATGCSPASTEPRLKPEADNKKVTGFYCTEEQPDCIPQGYVDLDTWPSVEVNVIDGDVNKEYGYIPPGTAALSSAYNGPPPCTSETVPVRDANGGQVHDNGGNLIWQTGYSGSCPTGPCYGLWLSERDAYREMIAGEVVGGTATLVSYITPAGHAVRIIRTVGAFVASYGFVGWNLRNKYQTALHATNDCRIRSGGYYTYFTVVIK